MAKKAQLDAEISQALAEGKGAKGHSAKALATLAIMGTRPEQWQLTPIKWVDEEREVPGLVKCPSCGGDKYVVTDESGKILPRPPLAAGEDFYTHSGARYEYDKLAKAQARATGGNAGLYGNCPTCTRRVRGWMIPQGTVRGIVRMVVPVGYPQFPPRTTFDSRYHGSHCGLCDKVIIKSGRVPVHATDDRGAAHGMFVGEDCAQKFLDVKIKRKADSIMESGNAPASER